MSAWGRYDFIWTPMYVCLCSSLTDHQIRRAARSGEVSSLSDLRLRYGACVDCGQCARQADQLVRANLRLDVSPEMAPALLGASA